MKWTPAQQSAIDLNGEGIVSAAAGAGKTAVLTERVVRLCREDMPLENMLVLTFTRAAASEMKGRIAAALQKAAQNEADVSKREFLTTQADGIAAANISTIHSFCRRIIGRHFHSANLSPSDRTMDESESAVTKREALDRALLELASGEPEQYRLLLGAFDSEAAVFAAAMKLFEFLNAQPDPMVWLTEAIDRLKSDEGLNEDAEHLRVLMQEELAFAISDMAAEKNALSPSFEKIIRQLDDELSRLRAAIVQPNRKSYSEAIKSLTFEMLRFPNGTSESQKKPLQDARDAVKKCVKNQSGLLTESIEHIRVTQTQSAVILTALKGLIEKFTAIYEQMKAQKAAVDYSDLEHLALKILRDERVRNEYREQIRAIIVDEYQDSNAVQDALLNAVSAGNNIFLVGDVKQSIYGFRLAEPSLFLEKCKKYPRINLSHNFRSSLRVLDTVNHIFEELMKRPLSPMDYDEEAFLRAGCEQPEGKAELHLIERISESEDEDFEDSEAQARLVAEQIHKRMADGVHKYSDFVILLRTMKNVATWAQTLSLYGIPCYAQSSGGYFDTIEVMVVLNVLRLIDNRRQDIPLLSVLRSPFGGYSDNDIAKLRIDCSSGDILDCLLAAKERGDLKAEEFLAFLDRWYRESRLNSIEDLIAKLLESTAFYDEMGAVAGGAQRQANLDALVDKAAAFSVLGGSDMHSFLSYMDGVEKNAKLGESQMAEANVVSIMTIHKAKGLEFPVVFLGELERQFNRNDFSGALQLHSRYGAALRYVDTAFRVRRDTLKHKIIIKELKKEALLELMRVLYVALTRAKRELIMVGSIKKAQEKLDGQRNPSLGRISRASCYLDWLMMTAKGFIPTEVHQKSEFVRPEYTHAPDSDEIDEALVSRLNERFDWKYPYLDAVGIPQKTTVTALGRQNAAKVIPVSPIQKEGEALSRGTATHGLLQRIGRRSASKDELKKLTDGDLMLSGAYVDDVAWFTQTELHQRMAGAIRFESELSFCYAADSEWLLGKASHERVLLQGIIDACFIENGGWVLIDYKTDAAGFEPASAMAERHRLQLEAYAKALEELSGLPVNEKYVVLLRAHEAVRL